MTDIFNTPTKTVTFAGSDVTIKPITMGRLSQFSAAIAPIASEVMGAIDGNGDMISAIINHSDRLIDAVHVATGIDKNALNDCLPDEFLGLAAAVIEINTDFFARRLLPSLKISAEGVRKSLSAAKENNG